MRAITEFCAEFAGQVDVVLLELNKAIEFKHTRFFEIVH